MEMKDKGWLVEGIVKGGQGGQVEYGYEGQGMVGGGGS